MRVLPYLRQSEARAGEDETTSLSLNAQLAAIEARGKQEGWSLLPAIRDHDVRGSDPNRAGIAELWTRVAREKPDLVAVFAMSRLARDYAWQEMTWQQLRRHGVRVASVTEPNIDHTLMRGMLGVVGQYQAEQIGQFLVASFERRAVSGLYHGEAPFGYHKVRLADDQAAKPVLRSHPTEGPTVQRVYELCRQGLRYGQIAQALNEAGVPPRHADRWSGNMIRLILRNPVYVGDVRYKGRIVATDAHEPLIDRATWGEAQRLLDGRPVVKAKVWTAQHHLEGLIRHACGRRMYLGESWSKRSLNPSIHFTCQSAYVRAERCPISRRSINAAKLDRAVRSCLAADFGSLISLDAAIAHAERAAGVAQVHLERNALENQRSLLRGRRGRAEHLYTTGRRPIAWFDQEDAEIEAAIIGVDQQIRALPIRPQVDEYAVARETMQAWDGVLSDAPGESVAEVLREVGEVVVGESVVQIAYHQPYSDFIVPQAVPVGRWGSGG